MNHMVVFAESLCAMMLRQRCEPAAREHPPVLVSYLHFIIDVGISSPSQLRLESPKIRHPVQLHSATEAEGNLGRQMLVDGSLETSEL
jgi:hypothetical protein